MSEKHEPGREREVKEERESQLIVAVAFALRSVMEEAIGHRETVVRDGPKLVALLKEMKEGLDFVRSKVQTLTERVKANHFPTADGISYLEAKHLLLLSYCQSIVYYLLRKAKGLSIEGHPVVHSLVETRLFLEKIRPIDKKLQYQVQKLTKVGANASENASLSDGKEKNASQEGEDLLNFRPNPELLVNKSVPDPKDGDGVYRPPKFAPTTMDEDKESKREKMTLRKEKETLKRAKQSPFLREVIDDIEGRPEEVVENDGVAESRETQRYMAKMEKRFRQEEELFTRAPLSKIDKKVEKHLKKSRSGLLGLTDGFHDEIKSLPLDESHGEQITGYTDMRRKGNKSNKRKRRH
ncbi:hypothetical protein H6P81_020345 [Aristolochia fimbriata]|uniref:Neuroguidin n=1 Tax=Aristolochia fimbriata TaxID=158543 RepID=A0AAV7DU50_ARIFI|nr:hypothetical protein H6P81_020345 [Aristolochia fimbriata]